MEHVHPLTDLFIAFEATPMALAFLMLITETTSLRKDIES